MAILALLAVLLLGQDPTQVLEQLTTISQTGGPATAGRRVHPESFIHGSSAQRMQWFSRGLQTGSVDACDPFA